MYRVCYFLHNPTPESANGQTPGGHTHISGHKTEKCPLPAANRVRKKKLMCKNDRNSIDVDRNSNINFLFIKNL